MDEPKSKSQKKREADALQKIGIQLVALSTEALDRLPLPSPLKEAILGAKGLKSHGAIRRQAQLIGKLMRIEGNEAIVAAYEHLCAEASAKTAEFHEIEKWRIRLLMEGNQALSEFIEMHPSINIQHLRQLIKKAIDEQKTDQNRGASKALFRYLRSCLQ